MLIYKCIIKKAVESINTGQKVKRKEAQQKPP
jgi:hypothetical protein